jgi:hypothetical protein
MVTAEDYNIAPLTLGSDILKVKSVNRISSGLSKYFDLSDVSGKYSKTNIFAADGMIYKNNHEQIFEFGVTNRNEILAILKQKLKPVIASPALRSFYFDQYERPELLSYNLLWQVPVIGQSRGYFSGQSAELSGPLNVGSVTSNNLLYITTGALVKFAAPNGRYFSSSGKLVSNYGSNTSNYIWAKISQVVGNGSNDGQGELDDGTGPIVLSNYVDNNAIPVEIIPNFINVLTNAFENELVSLCVNKRNFGLSFNKLTRIWNIIVDTNLDLINPFSLTYQGNIENANKDASWAIAFTWTGSNYKVRYRITDYIFESNKETAFFIDNDSINYDFVSNTVVKDQINVLSVNTVNAGVSSLEKDYQWQIDGSVIEPDGYVEPKKVRVSFYDYNSSGQITDPDSFSNIVDPNAVDSNSNLHNFVYFKTSSDGLRYQLQDSEMFTPFPNPDSVTTTPADGDLYYFYDQEFNVVKSYSAALEGTLDPWVYEPDYFAYPGRSNLKFHYIHNSAEDRRIDPSKSNIMDVYLLTSSYDTEYRSWLITGAGAEPMAPTSQSLEQNYGGKLDSIKTISDEIVFQPVRYKVLFGDLADINLQAKFKAVKNPARPVSDNELKSRILISMQNFFSLENWDFGQSFYFSELATYIMNAMTPDITNFVIVPKSNNNFGSLYEVACMTNELFINGATANDIEIISAITASQLKTSSIVTSSGN